MRPAAETSVVVLAPFFPPAIRGGGPIRTLDALTRNAPDAYEVDVITSAQDLDGSALPVAADVWVDDVDAGRRVLFAHRGRLRAFAHSVRSAITRPDVDLVYLNSFFDPRFSILPLALLAITRKSRPRLLIAPRGEFAEAALRSSRFRKQGWISAFRLLRLDRRVVWHASSEREADDIRRLHGGRSRIVVRENDTSLPIRARPAAERPAESPLELVFVGRLVEHKGLHLVLAALAGVDHPVRLSVIGPSEDPEYASRCRTLAAELPDIVRVEFSGTLSAADTLDAMARSDLMVCPTKSENFGQAIAESLSVSCPVAVADVTPWTPVIDSGGGVVAADVSVSAWHGILAAYAEIPAAEVTVRRASAGNAYETWRRSTPAPHVFDLVVSI